MLLSILHEVSGTYRDGTSTALISEVSVQAQEVQISKYPDIHTTSIKQIIWISGEHAQIV
jgi:hypothetical protein